MVDIVIILLMSCCFSEVAMASRQLWFCLEIKDSERPVGLSKYASCNNDILITWADNAKQVQPGWNIPLRAVVVSFVVVLLLSLSNIGSTTSDLRHVYGRLALSGPWQFPGCQYCPGGFDAFRQTDSLSGPFHINKAHFSHEVHIASSETPYNVGNILGAKHERRYAVFMLVGNRAPFVDSRKKLVN